MESLVFDTKRVHKFEFQGFGTSLCWFAVAIKDKKLIDYLCNLLFNPDNLYGLQLNVVRYNIGGSNDSILGMRSGGNVHEYSILEDWECVDENQRYFLKKSLECGAKVFEAFSNSPPVSMTNSGQTSGANPWKILKKFGNIGFSNNLKKQEIENFTSYLVNVTSYLIKSGIPFTSISPMNEPSSPGWVNGNNQEGCFYGFGGIRRKVFSSLMSKLKGSGIKVAGFEENNMLQAVIGMIINPFIKVDKYNVHRYKIGDALGFDTKGLDDSNFFRKILSSAYSKKPIWMSEVGFGSNKGLSDYETLINFCNCLSDDLIHLKPTAWVYWQVIEDLSNNGWGCLQTNFNNSGDIVYGSQFVAFQHFTHFIKPGCYLVDIPPCTNKKVKWVGSFNPLTLQKSVVITSLSTEILQVKFNKHCLKTMHTRKDETLYNYDCNIDVLTIYPNSVMSILFMD